ncbi:response regulator [Streptomyces sp. NPDC051940]|uniref:response regulator n=1 Tax=Streptomyces sp. NPDC051940 TaxID=3155675 RepID=UPI00343E8873
MTGRRRILVVDDNPDSVLALTYALLPLGHEIVSVPSGEDALKAALRGQFALILMDVVMPGGLNGLQTAALLKRLEQTRHIPILFLTGMPHDADRTAAGLAHGDADYLGKPVDPWELRAKVTFLIEVYGELARLRVELTRVRESEAELRRRLAELTDADEPGGGEESGSGEESGGGEGP